MRHRFGLMVCGMVAATGICQGQVLLASPTVNASAGAKEKTVTETPEAKKLKEENERKAKELLQRAYSNTKDLSESDHAAILARLALFGPRDARPIQSMGGRSLNHPRLEQ